MMGMYDSVIVEQLFCPYCGAVLRDQEWQTKDTECVLDTFDGLNDMFEQYPEVGYFGLINDCEACEMWIRLEVANTSEGHQEFMQKHLKELQLEWRKRAVSNHPDHSEAPSEKIWCSKCPKEDE